MADNTLPTPSESPQELSDTVHEDTTSLAMQNAISIQQGMQVITNTSVSSTCALILKQGSSE